jgi:signal transduction histidine kinase
MAAGIALNAQKAGHVGTRTGLLGFLERLLGRRQRSAAELARLTGQYQSPLGDLPISVTDLALRLAGQADAQALLHQAAEWLIERSGVACVVIYLHEMAANRLARPICVGVQLTDLPETIKLGYSIYGEVALGRRHYYIESVAREKRLAPVPPETQSAYILPLLHENQLLGVLGLYAVRPLALSEPSRAAIDRVATLIGALLSTAYRLSESQQAIARFDRFQRLAQDLTARLSSQELLQRIVEAARAILDAQMSILLDVNFESGELRPVAWSGIDRETALLIRSRLKEDLKGLVAWARLPARTPDIRTDQRTSLATQAIVAGMVSELAVPVLYYDELYGILAVQTSTYRNFTDEEVDLLQSLAAHAGIALRNARLFEALEQRNSELQKANAALEIARQQAENARAAAVQANRLKTEFINNMSHELRTPLNAVINFTRLVMDGHAGAVTEQQRNYLNYVHEGGQHLLGLINDILDLAKIEAGKMELRREPTPLVPLLKGVMSTLIGLTKDKGLALHREFEDDLPTLNIDGRRIRQVLLNLISNAAKFTAQGSITLRAVQQGDQVIISVRDTGVGIKPEDLPKVFEEFEQIDNALQETASGTGLGMPISRRLVQLHGGEMWIESQLGVGTTVSFSLPMG